MARNVAWGIDIGESAIKVVQLRKSGDSVVVQDHRTIACAARPEEAQGADKDYRIRNAIATLLEQVDIKGTVVVSISGQEVFPRFLPLPPVEAKRIPEVVRYEARTSMPFPIEEVVWDYQPLDEHPEPGEEIEVALFAIKRATVYGYLANLRLAHLVPDILEIGPLALYNLLCYDRDIDVGTVVIDVGAGNTDLLIIDGDRFWTRNVSISGNDITRALQEKYQISFEEAEQLKQKAADSKQAEKLFGVMRPIVDDLLGEIQRSIGYYKAQTHNVRIERVILLGNVFRLEPLVGYFRESLDDYDVARIGGLQRMRVAGADPAEFAPEVGNYGVAIGLALQGLGLGRVTIDMMPSDVIRQRLIKQKLPYAAAAVGLLAVPIFLGFGSAASDVSTYDTKVKEVVPKIQRYQQLAAEEKKAANLEPMASQLEAISSIGQGRAEWPLYMNSLNEALRQVPRNRFLLRRILHLGDGTAAPGMAGGGGLGRGARRAPRPAAAEDKLQEDAVTLLLEFESDQRFIVADTRLLEQYFIGQAYVRKVEFGEVRQMAGQMGGAAGGREGLIRNAADSVWVSSVTVVFSMQPLKESQPSAPDKAGNRK
ncbi:MAG: type IV pilus assembly protein PilM [Candidatus Brocadiae bacterium]|nr:type IV pilus assembly protein PilM [Candidatus Brocadiia bacterium]